MKKSYILFVIIAGFYLFILLLVFVGKVDHSYYMASKTDSMKTTQYKKITQYKKAYFAGGCFWCVEANYEKVDGVIEAVSGYSGGYVINPDYRQVSSGGTGHVEAVEVIYDPEKVSYNDLLTELWHVINPTDAWGSFSDRGREYRSVIFYTSEEEKIQVEQSIKKLEQSARYSRPIVTEVRPFSIFYKAEEVHQNYYKKNPLRYNYYRYRSGRDRYLEKIWGKDLHK